VLLDAAREGHDGVVIVLGGTTATESVRVVFAQQEVDWSATQSNGGRRSI